MPLAWLSTISTSISTAAWKRPGTPDVADLAARHSTKLPITPSSVAQKMLSRLKTEKSTIDVCLWFCRWVRW